MSSKLLLGLVVCLIILLSGCLQEPVLVQMNGSGSSSNQVKVTSSDTTPDYLSSKLEAGNNITLTVQNPGGDENILITSTATGSGGTCDNNMNCTITGRINTILDANFRNIKFNGTLSGGDFNFGLNDANGSQSCPAGQALSSVGSIQTCVSAGGDLNQADANTLYLKLHPTAQQIIDKNQNITHIGDWNHRNNSLAIPTVTLNNDAVGDNVWVRFMRGAQVLAELTSIAGFPFFECQNGTLVCGYGFDLTNFVAIGQTGFATSITDNDGIAMQGNTTLAGSFASTGNISTDSNLEADGNFFVHGSQAIIDFNLNARDVNAINTIYGQTIGSRGAINAAGTITGNIVNSSTSMTLENALNVSTGQLGWTISRDADSNLIIAANGVRRFRVDTNSFESRDDFIVDVNGDILAPRLNSTAASLQGLVYNSGNGEILVRISDSSYKLNQVISDVNADRLLSLELIEWTDKETGLPGIGYLAEDVCGLVPELCTYDRFGNIYGFDHTSFALVQTRALKKVKQESDLLKAQNEILKAYVCSQPSGLLACNQLNALTGPVIP